MNPLAARLWEWLERVADPIGPRFVLVPALWTRFWTDAAYQARVLDQTVPRAKTLAQLWRQVRPYVADPVWD